MIGTMCAPFHKVFADEFKIPVFNVRALIEACHVRKQTGLIRLISADEKALYLLVKNGILINSYVVSTQAWEHISPETMDTWIDSAGDMYTKFIPLSVQGLLVCKLLIQNTGGKIETTTQPLNIGEYLEMQKKSTDTSLVYFDWENSTGAVLFCKSSKSPYSIFVSSDVLYDQAGIAPVMLNQENSNYAVTTIGVDQSVPAWQEYLLRRVFADVCEHILVQVQELTGRALVDSLIRLIIVFASRRNLNIDISSRKVVDNELFSSPQQAADNYRLLLTEIFVHFSGITGSRLLSSTIRDIVTNLPVEERAIITTYPLFTEGYIYERRN
jgi:hypothetical protein